MDMGHRYALKKAKRRTKLSVIILKRKNEWIYLGKYVKLQEVKVLKTFLGLFCLYFPKNNLRYHDLKFRLNT